MAKIFDISVPIYEGMVTYPGDPKVEIRPELRISRGDPANVSQLCLGTHTGTHIDPPYHFFEQGASVEQIPLDKLIGPAQVVSLEDVDIVSAADLAKLGLPAETNRLLLKTKNSGFWLEGAGFRKDYVGLAPDAARWLVEKGFVLVGIDYLSIGPFGEGDPVVHHTLLEAGLVIVEGLNLSGVEPGRYELSCLPLKIRMGDGSPVRAVLIEL